MLSKFERRLYAKQIENKKERRRERRKERLFEERRKKTNDAESRMKKKPKFNCH